ncbi:MAG: bile acid:sodium symporter family protein [bacterium]
MLKKISDFCHRRFVYVVILAALLGFMFPELFTWAGISFNIPYAGSFSLLLVGLGIIMFGMGMTLSWKEVRRALSNPALVGLGVVAQYLIMPLLAFLLSLVFGLNEVLAAGVILVGCCPGGTASNVITFLADADVPLSVSVTLLSTFLAPLLTPWLMWLYVQKLMGTYTGKTIEVPVALLMKAIVVVVLPIVLGLLIKKFAWGEQPVPTMERVFTLVSVVVIAIIVAYVVASADLSTAPYIVLWLSGPVVLHNAGGLFLGYFAGRFWQIPEGSRRALSFEVGMQNSGLAAALAEILRSTLGSGGTATYKYLPFVAIPAVLFSVWHNITGPYLASRWSETGRE